MTFEDFIKEKENLMTRFLKLTEEALQRLEQDEEEYLPEIMEKRENLIKLMNQLEEEGRTASFLAQDQGTRSEELKARLLTENQKLLEEMQSSMTSIKERMVSNKKSIKVNKAYLASRPQNHYLNKKK